MTVTILVGDVFDRLREMPAESVAGPLFGGAEA